MLALQYLSFSAFADLLFLFSPFYRFSLSLALPSPHRLEALHGAGIIHMDIKPSNILIDEKGHTKICDMGLSFILKEGEKGIVSQKLLGTPGLEAPEVHRHELLGAPCDVFSLGATVFALALSRLPFGYEPNYSKLEPLSFEPLTTSSKWIPLSEDLKDLIKKMLTINAADRITILEIKKHPWFTKVNFDWVRKRERLSFSHLLCLYSGVCTLFFALVFCCCFILLFHIVIVVVLDCMPRTRTGSSLCAREECMERMH